jgi:hypothetical protein
MSISFADVMRLVQNALTSGDDTELRLALSDAELPRFADVIGALVTQSDPPVDALETLLDSWAESRDPIRIAAAVSAYGRVAVVRPDWWDDEIHKLHKAASTQDQAVQSAIKADLANMLIADSTRTRAALTNWLNDIDPSVSQLAQQMLDSA